MRDLSFGCARLLIIDQDLARLNELLREEGLDAIMIRRLIS